MANISFGGLDEVRLSMQEIAELPDEVIDEMLNAAADVTVAAQQREAAKLGKLGGHRNANQRRDWSTGTTVLAIKKGKVKIDKKTGSRVMYITPSGTRRRGSKKIYTTRNAEIAFLNEYGTRTIAARGWMRKANESSAAEATAAQMAVYDRFLKSRNL